MSSYAMGMMYSIPPAILPGTITGANNGLSRSTINPRLVVLGQDALEVGNPAALLNSRQIPISVFGIELTAIGSVFFQDSRIDINGDTVAGATPLLNMMDANNPGDSFTTFFESANSRGILAFANGVPNGRAICIGETQVNVTNLAFPLPDTNAQFEITNGSFATGQPSASGAGVYRFGKFVAGAVVPDAANYIEIEVDGVIRKFIVAT